MTAPAKVTNIVIAGLGGQGVLTASDILAEAAFLAGLDVKKSEIHGMSQRGGSVTSDVRFGLAVHSPMVPAGEADFMVLVTADQLEPNRHLLSPATQVLSPDLLIDVQLANKRSMNVALLGLLSRYLPDIPEETWRQAIRNRLPDRIREVNLEAFEQGRRAS
jgi:indolepyruvate ferredoxin oxidoreductase beta subunit